MPRSPFQIELKDWIAKYRNVLGSVLVAALAVSIGVGLNSIGGDFDADAGASPDLTTSAPDEAAGDAAGGVLSDLFDYANHPEIDQIDCRSLLSDAEVNTALGRDSELLQTADGEKCTDALVDDQGYFVTIEPGTPSHIADGEHVSGVGDDARWSPSRNLGTLTVVEEAPQGFLIFRITVGRPDMETPELLGVAKQLALAALPRFAAEVDQGAAPDPANDLEPALVRLEPEPIDTSNLSYVDNLLVREEQGEWSRGEGLVATLKLFSRELEADEVLRHPELVDYSGTAVLELASEYLTSGGDEQSKAEIGRLLATLVPSRELLDEAAQPPVSPPSASGLLVAAGLTLQVEETPQEWCRRVFDVDAPCLIALEPPPPSEGDSESDTGADPDPEEDWEPEPGKYVVFQPVNGAAGGWTSEYAEWALEAMLKSAELYETLGAMPPTSVTLSPFYDNHTQLESETGQCSISLGAIARDPIEVGGPTKGPFQQTVAARMARCLLLESAEGSEWWGHGVPIYLSGVVYPSVNREHLLSPWLRKSELDTSLLELRWSTWVFWERLHPEQGPKGSLSFAREASLSDLVGEFHSMSEELTDVAILDIGGGVVPYDPPSHSRSINGPTKVTIRPGKVGVKRVHVSVAAGKLVCEIQYQQQGGVAASWRTGVPGSPGGIWSRVLPTDIEGDLVFVVTGPAEDSQLVIDVKRVEAADDGCEEDPSDPTGDDGGAGLCGFCKSSYYWLEVGK